MKALILGIFSFIAIGTSAQANMQTSVDRSSGEELYACNAKIRHPTTNEAPECIDLSTGNVCDPKNVQPTDGACVCRSRTNYGDQIIAMDEWNRVQLAAANDNWSSLVPEGSAFGNKLANIEINLGSENLGAEFSVQFCYLGPAEKIRKLKDANGKEIKVDMSKGQYQLHLSLAGTNYNQALEWISFETSCQYRTIKKEEENKTSSILTLSPEGWSSRENAEHVFLDRSSNVGNSGSVYMSHETLLNSSPYEVPRSCVFEFKFREKKGARLKRDASLAKGNFSGSVSIYKVNQCEKDCDEL